MSYASIAPIAARRPQIATWARTATDAAAERAARAYGRIGDAETAHAIRSARYGWGETSICANKTRATQ